MVLSKKMYSFFHSSTWAKVLSESYKYQPIYFTLMNEDSLSVLIPLMEIKSFITGKRGISLPFSDHCDAIIDVDINFKDVLDCILEYGRSRNWKFVEIRGGQEFLLNVRPFSCFYSHTLDLSQDEDKIFSKFRDSTRRNIKKALREGVEINIYKSLESINKFYRLNCITRRTHGLPPQPFHFFKNISDFVISRDFGYVVLASHEKKTIAGAVFFNFGEKAFFKFGAMDRTYQHLRPSNLVMWEGIKWYCKNGYKTINFGRTDMGDEGLRQYKAGWGTKESIIKYYRFNVESENPIIAKTKESRIHNKIFNRMPISLLKFIGSISYKHMG
ncbi:MAG: lipid II:glycine glycyltransferase FemX [Candidatus Hodarchaeales archaeon]